MNISTRTKALVGAVAIGGAAIAMGGAFTAGGLNAGAQDTPAFVGGTGHQEITGAVLESITYDVNELDNKITSVTLDYTTTDATSSAIVFYTDTEKTTVSGQYTCTVDGTDASKFKCEATTPGTTEATTSAEFLQITAS